MQNSNLMDKLLDVNQQPPYVEVYTDAPLMCVSLVDTRQAMAGSSPIEQAYWAHGVQCEMDHISNSLGLYKVKAFSSENPTCLFSISPEIPARQQAEVMLHGARQLRDALTQMQLPAGGKLAAKVTIHAGKYAGAVVGRSAWTYDLFGDDVQLLLDMDRANSPNTIEVSDAALALMPPLPGEFTPVCRVSSNGQNIQMHAWIEVADLSPHGQAQPRLQPQQQQQSDSHGDAHQMFPAQPASLQAPLISSTAQPQPHQHMSEQVTQQLQQKQQELSRAPSLAAAITAAQRAAQSTHWQGSVPTAALSTAQCAKGLSTGAMHQNLRFRDPALEAAYMKAQSQGLASMDLLFILLNLAVIACYVWSSSSASRSSWWQQMAAMWGQWLLLPVAGVWLTSAPQSYGRCREVLWVVHRVLSALHIAGAVVMAVLKRHLVLGAAATAASSVLIPALALHKVAALVVMAENLGLKVRFHVHMLTCTFTCTVVILSALWYWSSSEQGSMLELQLWDMLQHLLLGWATPTVLIYLWEADDRLRFIKAGEIQHNKVAGPQLKCKDL